MRVSCTTALLHRVLTGAQDVTLYLDAVRCQSGVINHSNGWTHHAVMPLCCTALHFK